ncbi:MAG: TrkH family potassium uptake protein [Deferribacteres bacterium]|nr:TrkH family potassium uptake protein [candidate division KSB1 bacterium]MCB9502862.1 TrkH family potassium uptake protein [Deferribacteres bacterium]
MRFHIVLRYVGLALLLNSILMIIASVIAYVHSDTALMPLLYSALISILFGVFPLIFVPSTSYITNKEGLLIVVLSWLLSCLVGSLPYFLYGGPFDFTNAWFESVSGFTTTGSTILSNIEALPLSLLFWRAATHWIGGIGIIIFVLSVLPFLGIAEMVLFRSEVSAMVQENFQLRARKAIQILAGIYFGLTLLQTIALLFCGMGLFDAITHSFATIATGGFSTKNASVAYYNSPAIEIVIIVFMLLSGIHFGLLFSVLVGGGKEFWRSSVVRYYLLANVVGVAFTAINIHGPIYNSWTTAIRYSAFNIISVGTSTGFATADTSIWPALSHIFLLFFASQCACAGSTSGGIKADRIVLLWKAFTRQIKKLMHPNAIIPVRIDGKAVDDELVSKSLLFINVYLGVVLLATILLVATGTDILEAFSGTIAAMGNVGPGLGSVGSIGNFDSIPTIGKWILASTMLLGRMEIYALFIFFSPKQWKKRVSY